MIWNSVLLCALFSCICSSVFLFFSFFLSWTFGSWIDAKAEDFDWSMFEKNNLRTQVSKHEVSIG